MTYSHREPRVGSVYCRIEHSESRTRLWYEDRHARRKSERYEDPEDGDDTPFSDFIMQTQPPKGFKPPSDMETYDGSTDPQEHMDAFKSRMALARVSDLVRCRAFPITLKKATLKWFNSLPPRSMNQFSDLASIFLAHFTTKRFKLKPVYSLLGLHQRQNESLRVLERYNAETLLVNELQTQAAILTLLNGLRPRPFKTSLSKRRAESPEEIQTRVKKYIFMEETEKAITNPGRH